MNAKPTTEHPTRDSWLGPPDSYGLSTAPFPSGLMLTAWRGASQPLFNEDPSTRQQPVEPSIAHAAFAAALAIASILLVVFSV